MPNSLHLLFFPHEHNNHKPRVLHLSSLFVVVLLICLFQLSLTVFKAVKPGVLGFASQIAPETIIALTNQRRAANGVGPVQYNATLSEAARQKASHMFTFGCWSHNCNNVTPWWFFKNAGYDYLYAGENLAKDFGDPDTIVNAWMDSPTHRDNLINGRYKDIGVAVVDGVLNGEETTIVVQLFGTPAGEPKIATAQKAVAPQVAKQPVVQGENQQPAAIRQPADQQPVTKAPEILVVEQPSLQINDITSKPVVSAFALTKWVYLSFVILMIIVLAIDGFIISNKNIVRISGKTIVHLSFFLIILVSILLTNPGRII